MLGGVRMRRTNLKKLLPFQIQERTGHVEG